MPELAWSGNELIVNRGPQVQAPDIFTQSCGPGPACRQLVLLPSHLRLVVIVFWRSGEKKT